MEKQLHEYPIGQPIGLDNPPRLGQTYWVSVGTLDAMNIIPQSWGYSPDGDRLYVKHKRAYRTKEDALYVCRRGHLQEITE